MRAPADVLELIHRRAPACDAVAQMLPALADEDGSAKRRARAHVSQCLRCQAEVAAYRRMLRMMQTLRSEPRVPAPGTLAQLLDALEAEGGELPGLERRWLAVAGGVVAGATALGAAAAYVWLSRRPPRRPAWGAPWAPALLRG